MKKYYVLVDIGCIECGEESHVIGIFTDVMLVEQVKTNHKLRQEKNWHGQHYFKIFEIDEINKVYKVEY